MATLFLLDGFLYTGAVQYTATAKDLAAAADDVVQIVYDNIIVTPAGIAAAAASLDDYLTNPTYEGAKTVCAISLGAQVCAKWLREYGPTSEVPAADLDFVLMGNPENNWQGSIQFNQYGSGHGVPTNTAYDVTEFVRQYDGVADFPNNTAAPDYLLAVANAAVGALVIHMNYFTVRPGDDANLTYTTGNLTYILSPTRPWWQPSYALPFIEAAYNRPFADDVPPVPEPSASGSKLTTRYPSGPITPHGAYQILHDRVPQVALRSYDDTIVFNLMGGLSIADPMVPESVRLTGLTGLVPPWQIIDQKGATQDGTTFVDALYDPIEVNLDVRVVGRNPTYTRKVLFDLYASLDVKEESELSVTTHHSGRWWAKVRWFKPPDEKRVVTHQQELSLRLRADLGFWQSYPNVASFQFSYEDVKELFTEDYSEGKTLGPNWPQYYDGDGGGYCYTDGTAAKWRDDPDDIFVTASRTVVNGPYKDFTTTTDNQVITMTLGSMQEWSFPDASENNLWGRMGHDVNDDWDGNGVRLMVSLGLVRLSYFTDFTETVMRDFYQWIPPFPGESFTLVCGHEDGPRVFKVLRNNVELFTHHEIGTGSLLGSSYRGVGFGMKAGGAWITQATPADVRILSAGDNSTVAQTGYLERINVGDQPFWDRYTCFGPGTFYFGNGPGSDEMVKFGPLLPGQVMQIRTDPRKRGVVDMTSTPPTPQQRTLWQAALEEFLDFAFANNYPPLQAELESLFGIIPPQGNPYSLLSGRFSNPIPAKSPGKTPEIYHVKVQIDDGTADSKVIATGTPLRRVPY